MRKPRAAKAIDTVGGAKRGRALSGDEFNRKHDRGSGGRFASKPGGEKPLTKGAAALKDSGVGLDDTIVVLSTRVRAYSGSATVREFVDAHAKGRAYALRKLAADHKKGVIGFKQGSQTVDPPIPETKPKLGKVTTRKARNDRANPPVSEDRPRSYPEVDRSKLRPVDPKADGGVKDTDYLFSHLKKYPEGARVIDFVRDHPKGEAFARKTIAADLKQGRLSIERASSEFPPPPPRVQRAPVTDPDEWRAISFRRDDAQLVRALDASPRVGRVAPIPGSNAYAHPVHGIHMGEMEKTAHTAHAQATWRHEYGHHLDQTHVAGGSLYGYASAQPEPVAAMRRDAVALVRQAARPDARVLAERLRDQSDDVLDAALKEGKVDLTVAELRTIAAPQFVPDTAAALISRDAKAYLDATSRYRPSETAASAHGFSSDAIEALTQTRIGGQAAGMTGHGAAYYATGEGVSGGYTVNHGAEIFANYVTLRGSQEMAPSYKALRHLAPETAAVYDDLIASYRSRR